MPGNTQRLNTFRATFKPYFAQVGDDERKKLQDQRGPQRVCFTWATRHEVTSRADERDVRHGGAAYEGQAMTFNKNNMLPAPTMTFHSGRNFVNWKENQSRLIDQMEDVAPEDEQEVPNWMLDMESEQHQRFN